MQGKFEYLQLRLLAKTAAGQQLLQRGDIVVQDSIPVERRRNRSDTFADPLNRQTALQWTQQVERTRSGQSFNRQYGARVAHDCFIF